MHYLLSNCAKVLQYILLCFIAGLIVPPLATFPFKLNQTSRQIFDCIMKSRILRQSCLADKNHTGFLMTKIDTDLETLMQQALEGDKCAYAELLRETAHFLKPFLRQKLHAENEVDDLLQEILLSIHKVRHTYDGMRPFKPWVFAIAKYRLLDYLRNHYADRLHSAIDMSELENSFQNNAPEYRFSYESISGEIGKLPEKQALIIRMMHQEGYTAKEVAEKIGMTETAVKVAAHRAYKTLKHQLED